MLEFGRLGLGTAPLAGLYEAVDDETAHAVVERAWELGIRYFDTAPYYGSGTAECRLGAVLCERPREEFVLSTKVGRLLHPGESDWRDAPSLQSYFDFSYDAAMRSLEESLERLGLDRVDIALIHDPDNHYDEALAGAYP
ncbi:MAG: aldo/keto reductase, partial [Actinomycetota bacterium]|nr:aldo/keto reductase [Actinomycetota bacterium]